MRLGFLAAQAADGEQGVEASVRLSGRLALTLLDSVMPGPSAETTLARILASGSGGRVVVMSGWSVDGLNDRIRDGAFDGVTFLRKPFSFAQIQELLPPGDLAEPGPGAP